MDLTAILITALTGSGGIVALLAVIMQHKQKMKELELKTKESIKAKDAQIKNVINKNIPLEYHPVFTTIDELEYFFMRSFKLDDLGRTMVIREMCVNKLRTWREVIKKYAIDAQMCIDACGSCDHEACNKSENMYSKMLIEGLEKYTQCWETPNKLDIYGRSTYDKESLETMAVFIPIFKDWHKSREEVVKMAVHDIPNSGINITCHGDWWDMLTVYMYAFTQMKYDSLSAMKVLNGELTGKVFLGITVGDIH